MDRPGGLSEVDVACAYCGEVVTIIVDTTGGPEQEYVEDCPVCCRPWHVRVRQGPAGTTDVTLAREQ